MYQLARGAVTNRGAQTTEISLSVLEAGGPIVMLTEPSEVTREGAVHIPLPLDSVPKLVAAELPPSRGTLSVPSHLFLC